MHHKYKELLDAAKNDPSISEGGIRILKTLIQNDCRMNVDLLFEKWRGKLPSFFYQLKMLEQGSYMKLKYEYILTSVED